MKNPSLPSTGAVGGDTLSISRTSGVTSGNSGGSVYLTVGSSGNSSLVMALLGVWPVRSSINPTSTHTGIGVGGLNCSFVAISTKIVWITSEVAIPVRICVKV